MNMTKLFAAVIFAVSLFTAAALAQDGSSDNQKKFIDESIKESSDAKRYDIDVTYPALAERSAQAGAFNKAVKDHTDEFVADFRKILSEMTDEDRSFLPEGVNYTLDMGYSIDYAGPEVISVSFGRSTYTGGAHPNHWTSTLNFDMKAGKVITLASLFKPGSNYLKVISDFCVKDIIKQQESDADSDWIGRGAGPEEDNFKAWSITKEGLKFYFDPYQVGPYAAGDYEVTMPYSKIPAAIRSGSFLMAEMTSWIGGNPPNWCRGGLFPREDVDFSMMKVNGGKTTRAYFYGDDGNCPDGATCRRKAYVIGGDEVITSHGYGDFVCAWYQPAKGSETVGWIRKDQLRSVAGPERPASFAGEWVYGESNLSIGHIGAGALSVKGNAFWKGLGDNIHIGEVDAQASPVDRLLTVKGDDEYECSMRIRAVGDFLVVTDNKKCGGVNVTFDGVYRKGS